MAFVAYYQQIFFFFLDSLFAVSASLIQQQQLKRELLFPLFFYIISLLALRLCVFSFWSLVTYDRDSDFFVLFAWRSQGHMENRLSFLFLLFIILRSGFGS